MAPPSQPTIATLARISRDELRRVLQQQQQVAAAGSAAATAADRVAVIDVRDSDHVGGHIRGSRWVPSSTLDHAMPELVRQLRDHRLVVFHCALSQQRGPAAALRYLRERARLLGEPASTVQRLADEGARRERALEAEVAEQAKDTGADADGAAAGLLGQIGEEEGQKVYVLEGGFVKWQERYGNDDSLTEAYQKDLWEYGY